MTPRLRAENPTNLGEHVTWHCAGVVEGGRVKEEGLGEGVTASDACLVVTEGSSDSAVSRPALPVLAPGVADFFDSVGVSEDDPCTGTGILYRFHLGLARIRIRIRNRIPVVPDNDTSGREAHERIAALDHPPRMNVTTLPALEECRRMRTGGPSGQRVEGVNGRAAAVECFLDLAPRDGRVPTVRWAADNAALVAYQGEFIGEDEYARRYLKAAGRREGYDSAKLSNLRHHLVKACCSPRDGTRASQ